MQSKLFSDSPAGSILAKIANVTPANDQRITPADLGACQTMQNSYNKIKANLQKWEDVFSIAAKEFYNGQIKVERNPYGDLRLDYTARHRYDNPHSFDYFDYDAVKGWEYIDAKINELREAFVGKVIGYFNDAYNLQIDTRELIKNKTENYNTIIDYIFDQTGGLNLKDHGFKTLLHDLHKSLYKKENVTIERNRVIMANRYIYEGYSTIDFPYNITSKKDFHYLVAAICYFETGELGDYNFFNIPYGREVNFTTPYQLNGEKLDKIKFFKNNKVIAYFKTEQQAQDFYNMFELYSLKASN
jgi:hypothetical protein